LAEVQARGYAAVGDAFLENEFQRRKREDNFQRQVLAALRPVKRNRFLAIINSAFFIWCLSAFLLTIGGGFVTNHQQCMHQADQLLSRFELVRQEMLSRQLAFGSAVEKATVIPDLLREPRAATSSRGELASKTYGEIQSEYLTLIARVEYADLHDPELTDAQRDQLKFARNIEAKIDAEMDAAIKEFNSSPADGGGNSHDPARRFEYSRLTAKYFNALRLYQGDIDRYAYVFQPDCSAPKTLGVALGYKPAIMYGAVSPIFDSTKASLIEDIQNLRILASQIIAFPNTSTRPGDELKMPTNPEHEPPNAR
jgi:hypothetical protein